MTRTKPSPRRRTYRFGVVLVAAMVVVGACATSSPSITPPGSTEGELPSSSPPSASLPPAGAVTQLDERDIERSLAAGTYRMGPPFGVPTTITLPAGWKLDNLDQGDVTLSSGDAWLVVDIVESVFADPCESRGGPIEPPVSESADAVVEALVTMKGFKAGPVSDLTLGSHGGKAFELTNSIDLQNINCYGVAVLDLWTYRGGVEVWTITGAREQVWVVDVEGTPLVIDRGGPDVDAVAESIRFGSPTAWTAPTPTPAPTGPRLSYVVLGDSLLFAAEQDCDGCTSAAVLYGEQMATEFGIPVDVHNLTMHNRLTTEGLLAYLIQGARFGRIPEDLWDAVAGADVISVTIGFNDADNPNPTVIPALTRDYERNLDGVMAEIARLRAGKPTAIRVTNLYNNGGPSWTKVVEAMNSVACEVAQRYDAICVDLYEAFNGADGNIEPAALGLLGLDLTHPSQQGMEVIARALADTGYEPIR